MIKWKDVKGYEGLYCISSAGDIYSLKRKQYITPFETEYGYLKATLSKDSIKRNKKVDKLVAEHFILNPNNYPCVRHLDNDIKNNNADNLAWCTLGEAAKYYKEYRA